MTKHPIRWQLTAGLALLVAFALSTYGSRVDSGSFGAAVNSAKAIVEESGIKGGWSW